jgi:hypothetical protein
MYIFNMERNQHFKFYLGDSNIVKGNGQRQGKEHSGTVNLHNFFVQKGFNPKSKQSLLPGGESPISFAKRAAKELSTGTLNQPQINIINIKNLNYIPGSKTFDEVNVTHETAQDSNTRQSKLARIFGRGKSCQVGGQNKTYSGEDSVLQRSIMSNSKSRNGTRTHENSRANSTNAPKRKVSLAFDRNMAKVIAQINEKMGVDKDLKGKLFQKLMKISKAPVKQTESVKLGNVLLDSAFRQVSLFISQQADELGRMHPGNSQHGVIDRRLSAHARSRSIASRQLKEKSCVVFRDSSSDLNNVTMSNLNVNQTEDTKGSICPGSKFQAKDWFIRDQFERSYQHLTRSLVAAVDMVKPKKVHWSKRTSSESTQTDRTTPEQIGYSSMNMHNLIREFGDERLGRVAKPKQTRPVLAKKMYNEGKVNAGDLDMPTLQPNRPGDSQTRVLSREVYVGYQKITVYEESLKILRDMGFDLEELASRGYSRLVPPSQRLQRTSQQLDEDSVALELQVSGASLFSNYTKEVQEARAESRSKKQKNVFQLDFKKLDASLNDSANEIEQEVNG